jgi:ATP-dependent DNA helicase PIF1
VPAAPASATPDAFQQAAIDAVLERRENVFITGAAGSGKSSTLRWILRGARERGLRVAVMSSTGISAVNLACGATTVHNFLSMDAEDRPVQDCIRRIRADEFDVKAEYIRSRQLLVIDEVSMLSAEFLGKVHAILESLCPPSASAYGGKQIVLLGDFAQLRPVPPRANTRKRGRGASSSSSSSGTRTIVHLAFHAPRAWIHADIHSYVLGQRHRQSTDTAYAALLDRMRFARCTPADIELLRTRIVASVAERERLGETSVFLFARNVDVDAYNTRRLGALDAASAHVYEATQLVHVREGIRRPRAAVRTSARAHMRQSMRAGERLELRVGAKVLLLTNLNVTAGLANGTQGVVVDFDAASGFPLVEFERGAGTHTVLPHTWKFTDAEYTATHTQVPLMLAWATSIHKSQGMTLSSVVADLSPASCFAAGMAYVVASRVQCLADLHLQPSFSSAAIYADAEVVRFCQRIETDG